MEPHLSLQSFFAGAPPLQKREGWLLAWPLLADIRTPVLSPLAGFCLRAVFFGWLQQHTIPKPMVPSSGPTDVFSIFCVGFLVSSPHLSWVDLLPSVQFLLNDTDGVADVSPHLAVFGRSLCFLSDEFSESGPRSSPDAEQWFSTRAFETEELRRKLAFEREKQKESHDENRSQGRFCVGDLVWVDQTRTANKIGRSRKC